MTMVVTTAAEEQLQQQRCSGLGFRRTLLLVFLLLLHLNVTPTKGLGLGLGLESERLALLEFKNGITGDPFRVMSSWNDSIHFCEWAGVSCTPPPSEASNHQRQRRVVMILNLENQKLVGSLPPSIGNLTSLTTINLRNNFFHGVIPREIGRLLKLQYLSLTWNSFTGEIPTNLTHCTDLRALELASNQLVGSIPDQLSSLTKLLSFQLGVNNLTGRFPPWVGNLSSLEIIYLTQNHLHGEIPEEIGGCSKLGDFQVYDNNLSGTIPPSIYNISSLFYFAVAVNNLHGTLPPDIGLTLPNLRVFAGGVNSFTGPIPISLGNSSGLQVLDFEQNRLTGSVPINLGRLQTLTRLNFGSNQLGFGKLVGDHLNIIITALVNCTNLEVLGLDNNNLGGELPESIANLSTYLTILTIGTNGIGGKVPAGIGNLVNLTLLGLENNLLSGSVPLDIGKLQKLQKLYLNRNRFSGLIPTSIGNLSLLNLLFMEVNSFEGSIPPSLGNCQNLIVLSLPYNNLNGTIPKQIFSLTSLSIYLSIAHNSLSGSLPLEVGNLKILEALDLSNNKLSGKIPTTLANIISLERLYLGGNFFQGTIPESLSSLRAIQRLDLSSNKLSGNIPEFLENNPSLKFLNLSFNDFNGEVPKNGIFADTRGFAVGGNNRLCGGITKLKLPACLLKPLHKPRRNVHLSLKVIILGAFGFSFVFLLSILATYYLIRKWRNKARAATSTSEDGLLSVSYAQLFKSTDGFSKDYLLGVGSFGSVYKGNLDNGSGLVVATKVLNLQQLGASKSFISECEALKNIRHRNLVKIITACSSVDYKGNDFKALVYEFMSNGNLDQWLHPQVCDGEQLNKSLNLSQRLNIAIDVASALEYLHHDCEIPIAHCDLKPSNVLLDDDMAAHVSDFGLARFLLEKTTDNSSTSLSVGLKGSIGYIPPEYGMGGQVSIFGDIYSYGILLLEMVTGRRPTDDMFKDGLCLHNFAAMSLPDRIMEIVDPLLFLAVSKEEQQEEDMNAMNRGIEAEHEEATMMGVANCSSNVRSGFMHECLVSMIRIGIACSMPLPSDRMVMKDVVSQMQDIRKFLESHYI